METSLEENRLYSHYYGTDSHYEELCRWWNGHKWPIIPKSSLPQIGIIISDGSENICAGFLYKTDSCIAWTDFYVSNPDYKNRKLRTKAIDLLLHQLTEFAKDAGFKVCFTSISNTRLIKRLEYCGYQKCDTNMTNMIKVL